MLRPAISKVAQSSNQRSNGGTALKVEKASLDSGLLWSCDLVRVSVFELCWLLTLPVAIPMLRVQERNLSITSDYKLRSITSVDGTPFMGGNIA